ncbi:winged helix-turn-helix transcriptional regulator [Nocardia rhizosphaerihabitans]|uniref:winged helix-turn-helix transcriptional regulator n=1 Tax=Nocardia rhizosphaerihabitans TaxID=1691570 RepID=UPI00366DD468
MTVGPQVSQTDADGMGDGYHPECSWRETVDLSGRWVSPTLHILRERSLRFFELQSKIDGISDKMLSQTLRILVRDGLVTRTVEPATPPRVSYELTPLGHGLAESLEPFMAWIRRHATDVARARAEHDRADVQSS